MMIDRYPFNSTLHATDVAPAFAGIDDDRFELAMTFHSRPGHLLR